MITEKFTKLFFFNLAVALPF